MEYFVNSINSIPAIDIENFEQKFARLFELNQKWYEDFIKKSNTVSNISKTAKSFPNDFTSKIEKIEQLTIEMSHRKELKKKEEQEDRNDMKLLTSKMDKFIHLIEKQKDKETLQPIELKLDGELIARTVGKINRRNILSKVQIHGN